MGLISQPTEFSSRLFLFLSVFKLLVHNAGLTFLHENSSVWRQPSQTRECQKSLWQPITYKIVFAKYHFFMPSSKLTMARTTPSDLVPWKLMLYFLSIFWQKEIALYCLQLKYRHEVKSLIADTAIALLLKHLATEMSTNIGF